MRAVVSAPPRRFLHLWLDRLPTDRMRRSHEAKTHDLSGPLALVARSGAALRLTAVDAAAEALGAHPGLSLADVRARAPDVRVLPADPTAAFLPAIDASLLVSKSELDWGIPTRSLCGSFR